MVAVLMDVYGRYHAGGRGGDFDVISVTVPSDDLNQYRSWTVLHRCGSSDTTSAWTAALSMRIRKSILSIHEFDFDRFNFLV